MNYKADNTKYKIVVHGGAGFVPVEYRHLYAEGCRVACQSGLQILKENGTAIDAVEQAVISMENNSTFNAGRGSVLTLEETIEMDAMIMDGATLRIGGVMCLSNYLNPIAVSRKIMENDRHCFYQGDGAGIIAQKYGFSPIPNEELITERVRERFKKLIENRSQENIVEAITQDPEQRDKYGTVGAIALDKFGNLAAATSTGGFLGKTTGRVGDTPIPGAGTYADEEFAISSTGIGEFIIRSMLGMRIKLHLRDLDLYQATVKSLQEMYNLTQGKAGIISLNKNGDHAALCNTEHISYAYSSENDLIIDYLQENSSVLKF